MPAEIYFQEYINDGYVHRDMGFQDKIAEINCRVNGLENCIENIANDVRASIIEKIIVEPNDLIIIKFPLGEMDIDTAHAVHKLVMAALPDNKVIMIPDEFKIDICSLEQTKLTPASEKELHEFLAL